MDDFEIFATDGAGRPSNLNEVMDMIRHHLDDHDIAFEDAIGILVDLIRPGNGPNSHDVRPIFTGAMYAYGRGYLCPNFEALYVTTLPWGVGFSIAVKEGFKFDQLFRDEQNTITKALCTVLQVGGLQARLDNDNLIVITDPDGEESEMSMDDIVSQFRVELDENLGPDGPDDDDPMRRWMP